VDCAPARAKPCGERGEALAAQVVAGNQLPVGRCELAERAIDQIAQSRMRLRISGLRDGIRDSGHVELFILVAKEAAPVGSMFFRGVE